MAAERWAAAVAPDAPLRIKVRDVERIRRAGPSGGTPWHGRPGRPRRKHGALPSQRSRRAPRATTERQPKPAANAAEVEQAEVLIAVVDAMPADEMVKRIGDADVQAALETSAAARMLAD